MRKHWWIRVGIGCGLVVAGWDSSPLAHGQVEKVRKDNAPSKDEPTEIALHVTRQKSPDPLFKYRLLPLSTALNSGNAVPVYLRLDQQTSSDRISEMQSKASELMNLPIASFPQAEARTMVEDWAGKLRHIEIGTRRERCEWDYPILEEKENPFFILLPDAQAMRGWSRLLAVKLRWEIAAGQADQAIQTMETSIAFGRHVGSGPFYINKLIGITIINGMLSQLDDLIGQAGTPNLYWALTALPGSFVDMREAAENEQVSIGRTLTGQRLDEIDLTRLRSDAGWSTMLADLHARTVRLRQFQGLNPELVPATPTDLAVFKSTTLPQARDYLKAHGLTATTDDQTLVVMLISLYRELADETFKIAHLSYPKAAEYQTEVDNRIKDAKSGPGAPIVAMLPTVHATLLAEVRVAQKIAALRVVEALRLHAAEHAGDLPDSLDQIKLVPIPDDPASGKPFEYRREGRAAILTAAAPPQPQMIYRITIRP